MKTNHENITTLINELKEGRNLDAAEMMELKQALQNAICLNHTGKMEGLQSLSTSVKLNKQCQENAKIKGSICSHCYAAAQMKRYRNMSGKYELNTIMLTSVILPLEVLPTINSLYFRFEAFGDLNNAVQVVNYFNICKKNPLVNFALWTKNPHLIAQAMNEYGTEKPSNINIVYSSLFMNHESSSIFEKYSFIDKVFTVYDPQYIESNNININCGGRHCATCLRCYKKDTEKVINEKLK